MNQTLIVGYGFVGRRVAEMAVAAGDSVWATTRSAEKMPGIERAGVRPIRVDWTDRRTLAGLPDVNRVLVAVSYDARSGQSRYDSQVGGLRNLLGVLSPSADIVYVSTTGVFHQSDGRWVDEQSPAWPTREGGRVHLQAESLLHQSRPKSPWTILRFAGIYGPGRVPRSADVIAGRPIAIPNSGSATGGYLNLIHVDDGAAAVMGAWRKSQRQLAPRLYLVCDDRPVARVDFYREIARLTRSPEPTFVDPPADAPARMRSDADKRICNRAMKRDFLPKMAFPTFREGLAAVLPRR